MVLILFCPHLVSEHADYFRVCPLRGTLDCIFWLKASLAAHLTPFNV